MTENINNVSNASKIYFIGIEKIINNNLNDVYADQDISDLVESIKRYGLKQPLSVVREGDSLYRLIAGHRRLAAIKYVLSAGEGVKFGNRVLMNQVPCIFDESFENEDDEFLNLLSSNVSGTKTEEDMKKIIQRTAEIYEKRKGLPEYAGKKRDVIAKMAGVSPRSVDKYLKSDFQATEKQPKIMPVSAVETMIEKMIVQIKTIDMEEYGKTDRSAIRNSIEDLIAICGFLYLWG